MDLNLSKKLASENLIEYLKKNGDKYADSKDSKSLISVFEQHLFVWHEEYSCVLAVELSHKDPNAETDVKLLYPTCPPAFEVESVMLNRIGNLLALVGKNGIMILEIPWHYGQFHSNSGNDNVFCKAWNVAEKFFICTSRVSIIQAVWHPGSPACTHIVVLSSDNYIRLYDGIDSQTPIHVVQLGGSSDCHYLSSSHTISMQACLGESAVSFDFGPPETFNSIPPWLKTGKATESGMVWPIYVLYGNGDVYIVRMSLKKLSLGYNKVQGPLAMYPAAEDNYGVDACSLLCLHSNPPVLVIAMASGIIYHCIVLDNLEDIDDQHEGTKSQSQTNASSIGSECPLALYVYGSVELPITLTQDDIDYAYGQTVRLYKDVTSNFKYHCSLVSSVHSVAVPFVQRLIECNENSDLEFTMSQLQKNDSIVEHLLCTRPLSSVKSVPVLGLATMIVDKGISMICLLASWEFTCLALLSSYHVFATPLLSSSESLRDSEEDTKSDFEQQMQYLCGRSTCTPILKLHHSEAESAKSSQQMLELLCSTTQRFREEYIQRLSIMEAHIASRSKTLIQRREQQIAEIQRNIAEQKDLCNNAEKLAEKYEDVATKQKILLEKLGKVLQLLQQRYPILSTAEIKMKQELILTEDKIETLQKSLDQIKKKFVFQKQKRKELEKCSSRTNTNQIESLTLSDVKQKHIKEILEKEGDSINKLLKNVSTLKNSVAV